ncbi:MAG: hypothetical protein R6W82_08215 [bacterium]
MMSRRGMMFPGVLFILAGLLMACEATGPVDGEGVGDNRNWAGEYLRIRLIPEQRPMLGEYSSGSQSVIQQHINWAELAAIDFLAIPWRGGGTYGDMVLTQDILGSAAWADATLGWCVLYELPTILEGDPEAPAVNLTLAARDTLLSHLEYFNERFFSSAGYLFVDGRPVVILRRSRLIASTDARQDLLALRQDYRAATGEELFLVGDEATMLSRDLPNSSRISAFDMITGIDLAVVGVHNGYPQNTGFFEDVNTVWNRYALDAGSLDPPVPLMPTVMPGFNDRASTALTHPIIAREATAGMTQEGTTYQQMWTLANNHAGVPAMALLNSFNGWREDTQIEPVADNGDANGATLPGQYTDGVRYFPYEMAFIEETATQKGNLTLGAIYEVWYDDRPPDLR